MTSSSSLMRAAVVDAIGQPLRVTELARPVPAQGEVLVRIHASGVNPLDTKVRAGQAAHARQPLPSVLGMDLAGVVEAVGPGVARFKRGDEVYGLAGGIGGLQGTLAEYAAVDADLLALKPHNLSMREAAGLPLVFITAYEGLVDRAKTQRGQSVLVHGGAGGVGHMAVQLARALGAEVFATGAPAHAQTIRRFGATPIDYTATSVDDYVARHTGGEGFDVVYDTVGGAVLDARSPLRATTAAMWSAASAGARTSWRRCRFAPPPIRACSRCCRCSRAVAARTTARSWRPRHGWWKRASSCR